MMRRNVWLGAAVLCGAVSAACAAEAPPQTCDASGVCALPSAAPVRLAGPKQMWAASRLFTDAPALDFAKWLTEKPDTKGKFIIVEFWRTWCGACKRNTALLNAFQKKHGGELVVIGVTGEAEAKVKAYDGPKKEYALALDKPRDDAGGNAPAAGGKKTAAGGGQVAAGAEPDPAAGADPDTGVYEAWFNVWGWPHVVILEPEHHTIIWEGFPGLAGYELTEAKIEKILAIGRKK
jgi:thiol-disulfide isomerase/thioredoxin